MTFKVQIYNFQVLQKHKSILLQVLSDNKIAYKDIKDDQANNMTVVRMTKKKTWNSIVNIFNSYNVTVYQCSDTMAEIESYSPNKDIITLDNITMTSYDKNQTLLQAMENKLFKYGMIEEFESYKQLDINTNLRVNEDFVILLAKIKIKEKEEQLIKVERELKEAKDHLMSLLTKFHKDSFR